MEGRAQKRLDGSLDGSLDGERVGATPILKIYMCFLEEKNGLRFGVAKRA